jgi:hypothetical protein
MAFDPVRSESEQHKELGARLSTFSQGQEERLAEYRAEQLGLPYINLVVFPIDSDVLERIPKKDAIRAQGVLFYKQGGDVRVGVVDPSSPEVKALAKQIEERMVMNLICMWYPSVVLLHLLLGIGGMFRKTLLHKES